MLTKVATGPVVEWVNFTSPEVEKAYWSMVCSICQDRECDKECIILVPDLEECSDCTGAGRVEYVMRPQGKPQYNLITVCGHCEGLGLL